MSRIKSVAMFLWKLFVGTALCQYSVTSVLVVGWSYRLMQRAAVRRWILESGDTSAHGDRFNEFRKWPNWIVQQNAPEPVSAQGGAGARIRKVGRGAFGSLKRNAVIGFQGIVNTWILTFLPTLFWVFGWYSGWDNSFNKGYEQFSVGIALSLVGIGLFIAAMLYVPMAQARQAVTGEWRSFYDFRLVRLLIRRHRFASLLLAIGYSLVSLPVIILKTLPNFFPQAAPRTLDMGSVELLAFLDQYYFRASLIGFACFVVLRLAAARLYATSVASAVKDGIVCTEDLSPFERETLDTLGIRALTKTKDVSLSIKVVSGTASRLWRAATIGATVAVWFSFVAQIYASEFINYHPKRGWLNQPLVQLPWFRYVPNRLMQAAREEKAKARSAEAATTTVDRE